MVLFLCPSLSVCSDYKSVKSIYFFGASDLSVYKDTAAVSSLKMRPCRFEDVMILPEAGWHMLHYVLIMEHYLLESICVFLLCF